MGEQAATQDLDGCCGGHEIGHHVHFSEDTDEMGNTAIVVKEKQPGVKYEAHVGFLQILHWYHITVQLPLKDAGEGYVIGDKHGVYCEAVSLKVVEGGGLEVLVNMLAHKEKLLKETITLLKPSGEEVKIIVLARVLGRQKGTPMLRNGIKCYKVEHDEESEASDWQGFT
ncbi:UPF0687 protein C20orf27 [Chionoecetes opilio]|uniref:Adipose-secreted signaling protein n=1 Tax=Chionoecetes opilio TaxID=41210 RepID=A0A8J4Y4G2_CHIOP|nr:UPF0687 protein C20orf27 [Chionoecetes opilio]